MTFPIGTFTTASKFEASTTGSDLLAARCDLWNGSISHMVTCLPKASDYATNQTITPEAFGSAYKYDQLNRLSSSRVFTNINNTTNQWQSGSGTNPTAYATDYTYDAMGNILTQKRNGGGASPTALDELTYNYHTTTDGLVSNRLYQVNDVVSAGNYSDDIDDQGTFNNTHSTIETANNYGYDELGNIVRDVQEEIASIEWTVYGKMKKITRNSGSTKADLEFGYDASGNRLWKKVTPKGSGAVISTYYYLRDAQGNEMCRYVKYTNTSIQLMYVAQEHSIYGSSRVGVDNRKDTLYKAGSYSPAWGGANTSRRALGLKSFELSNHLGNVLVTVSDKPVYKVSSGTIYFNPEISSISDYYPFGAPINGRGYSSDAYRFGFNTQEKDDEVNGEGNHNTALFWEYDSRLGRRWNTDPVVKPWESLYACLSDNPILLNDPDGNEPEDFIKDNKGKIKWDKKARSQATTKVGEIYLGKNLTFTFNSYIDGNLWDGPMGSFPVGPKLTSTIEVTSHTSADNNLLSVDILSIYEVHSTGGIFPGDDYYPGQTNTKIDIKGLTSGSKTFEQHAKVNSFEEAGLMLMDFDKVNVAQKLTLGLSGNVLSVTAATDIFPSATLSVNNLELFKYNQPSFQSTHGREVVYREPRSKFNDGLIPVTKSLRPSPSFHLRYSK
jgi:hypothetical protein